MHLARLRLRDFRNYGRLDVAFGPGFHLILGDNAQGKTNLLEALYLLATLRSFRGVGSAHLVRHGAKGYFIGASVVGRAQREVQLYWSAAERRVALDRKPVKRITDYLGVFRAVVFCSEDLQLVKGTGRVRRRFLDLLLSQTRPDYLALLQRYTRALRSRNALLRQPTLDERALEGFTHELILAGDSITASRRALVPQLAPLVKEAHAQIAAGGERLTLSYQPQVKRDFAVELARSRARERTQRMTVVGPHRDELLLHVDQQPAARFGSEGQKRTIALALKMAQAACVQQSEGSPPVLLMDDVMGELDVRRRSGLIPLFDSVAAGRGQVFMTCTEENWPRELGREIQRWHVQDGLLTSVPSRS
jgi:DNA replication and repair protein RecF